MLSAFSPRTQGLLAINLAAVIFGTAALYGKLDVSPLWITAMRAGFGALALVLVGGLGMQALRLPRRAWTLLVASGGLLAVHWLTFFMAVQLAGVAVATLTFATFPLFTVLVEAAARNRLPSRTEGLTGLVILFAVGLLVEPGADDPDVASGAVAGLVSALAYALFWRLTQRLQQPLSPASLSFCQNGVVFLLLAPVLPFATPALAASAQWLALAALGVLNTAILLLLYLYALRRIPASACSGFVALEPVYAIAFAAWLFGEPVTAWILLSIVLIVGASLVLLRTDSKQAA